MEKNQETKIRGLMKILIYLFVVVIFISSCGSTQDEIAATQDDKDSLVCIMPEPPRIGRAMWLIGEWENTEDGATMFESWVLTDDSLLTGLSFTIDNGDTVQYETVELIQRGTDLYYIPTVSDQNDEEPVEFLLTVFTDSTLIFENPDHDFPQRIAYTNYRGDSLLAVISGIYGGKNSFMEFPMKRIK